MATKKYSWKLSDGSTATATITVIARVVITARVSSADGWAGARVESPDVQYTTTVEVEIPARGIKLTGGRLTPTRVMDFGRQKVAVVGEASKEFDALVVAAHTAAVEECDAARAIAEAHHAAEVDYDAYHERTAMIEAAR